MLLKLYFGFFQKPATKSFLVLLFFLNFFTAYSQRYNADSMLRLLNTETTDSNRVTYLWQMADYAGIYNPDTAIHLAQEALSLARRIKYVEGESRSLGILANTFMRIGNYPRALDYNFQKLKIEEQRIKPRNMMSVLMNIGIVYMYQEEYRKALSYYFRADSIIQSAKLDAYRYHGNINIGDTYDRLNILDSAFYFYSRALGEAKILNNQDYIGTSETGLGHLYRKQSDYLLSLEHYKSAIVNLGATDDNDLLCEAHLGLAKLYLLFNNFDSAVTHAKRSYNIGQSGGFISRQLDAVKQLSDIYKKTKNIDSAFAYVNIEKVLNDSVYSRERIRGLMILSSDEQLRQREMAEAKIKEEEERRQRLQLMFIGIFIPAFFMLTLFLSRVKMHIRVIKLLGILSLLIFFEYLTLLLHPTVAKLTNHTPVLEILIFVAAAAVLIPLHHRAEHWLIRKLLHKHIHHPEENK
ncbi:MAG: tetratricopeptide repeat protein [Bacteroidetes bacterium]|nr:MAG: tetratricopeptide repeat protein [Bacteroidota bacterium]